MEALNHINKIREYCDYIERHIKNVATAWRVVKEKCEDLNFISDDFHFHNIDRLIHNHDISKLSKEEFIQYQKYFYPVTPDDKSKVCIDSDFLDAFGNDKSKVCIESNFLDAWENHKRLNPHHWENWTQKPDELTVHPDEWMWHCVCMVCDWMAMGYEFGDTAKEYYENNKHKIKIPDYAEDLIYQIFERVY